MSCGSDLGRRRRHEHVWKDFDASTGRRAPVALVLCVHVCPTSAQLVSFIRTRFILLPV